jgi:urease accessory protein
MGDGSRLAGLYQRQPLRLMLPRVELDEPPLAVIVNCGGGLVGGDRLEIDIEVGAGAALRVTGQAAEKVYRSAGPETRVDTRYQVGAGGWLEVLPQGTILFQGVNLRRLSELRLTSGGRAMLGEVLVLGRHAMGEALTRGRVHDGWRIFCNDRLVWADALHLGEDMAGVLDAGAGFAGAKALATFIHAGAGASALLDAARELAESGAHPTLKVGATSVGGVLLVRWLGADAALVRRAFGGFWASFRALAGKRPARLPTIWAI